MTDPNGCGPWWLPDRWRDLYFVEACNVHDAEYGAGVPQATADRNLLKAMRNKINLDRDISLLGKNKRTVQLYFFYYLVRMFGAISHQGWIKSLGRCFKR